VVANCEFLSQLLSHSYSFGVIPGVTIFFFFFFFFSFTSFPPSAPFRQDPGFAFLLYTGTLNARPLFLYSGHEKRVQLKYDLRIGYRLGGLALPSTFLSSLSLKLFSLSERHFESFLDHLLARVSQSLYVVATQRFLGVTRASHFSLLRLAPRRRGVLVG